VRFLAGRYIQRILIATRRAEIVLGMLQLHHTGHPHGIEQAVYLRAAPLRIEIHELAGI